MAWTESDIEVIERAIASGTLSVQYADRSVTYRSVTDLLKARNAMRAVINGSSAGTTSCTYASFSKGGTGRDDRDLT